ncbi:hypothetical protein [Nocardia testacea]|uniref:hypothetical protein n=1 Tax=Nocardia testacea TaxID=248551 RepID=UPI003A86CFD7
MCAEVRLDSRISDVLRRITDGMADQISGAVTRSYHLFVHNLRDTEQLSEAARRGGQQIERAYQPSAAERALRTLSPDKPARIHQGVGSSFMGRSPGGVRTIYKPSYLETLIDPDSIHPLRYGIPRGYGQHAARETAAYRVDEALGFGRVPPTTLVEKGPYGPGSNQVWVPSSPGHAAAEWNRRTKEERKAADEAWYHTLSGEERAAIYDELLRPNKKYPQVQREQMAVLDYVIGNTDRHWGNYRTGSDGDIVAIDHAFAFPESPDSRFGIRSDFVREFRDKELSAEVVDSVRALDMDELRTALLDTGLSDKAVDGALDRLMEIRIEGKITGENWPGEIVGAREIGMPMAETKPTAAAETAPIQEGWIEL